MLKGARSRLPAWGIIALRWLAVTLALSSLEIHSGTAYHDYVSPRLGGAWIFAGAFVLAALLGLGIESPRLTMLLTVAMCTVSAAVYSVAFYSPAWMGIIFGTVRLQNYVTQQGLLVFLWSFIPAIAGALAGNFAGAGSRASARDRAAGQRDSWWDRPRE